MILFNLLATYGLAFLIKESDGPWGIMAWIRNILMRNKYVGVFFYKLFDCYFCTGCWSGLIIYLLSNNFNFEIKESLIWIFAGGAISYIIDSIIESIRKDD